jgi:hypothetical protein
MKIPKLSFVLPSLTLAFVLAPWLSSPAQAIVTVADARLGCSSFSATGTTNQPFVTIYTFNNSTLSELFQVVPVTGGSFSLTLDFLQAPQGTSINYEVWGSPITYVNIGAPGFWDGESYFNLDAACIDPVTPVPTLDIRGYALLAALLAMAGFVSLRRRVRARA